jgi:lipoyl(octanoyl) transferase
MIIYKDLGIEDYASSWQKMKDFTAARTENSDDELWLLEHPPVYTQGQAGKAEHVLNPENIPVIQSDRGGQVTYHGPGQLVGYLLFDTRKQKIAIRTLVTMLENSLIEVLSHYQIIGETRCKAPGVYVADKKIASIGLRVKNGCTYHGIALNVDMDLHPFKGINPCGFEKMEMTQIADYDNNVTMQTVKEQFIEAIDKQFGN